MSARPPLSLYVHLPWCKRKCPYCDFNSHEARGDAAQAAYLRALSEDLRRDLAQPEVAGRKIDSVFIGGGTPSLFDAEPLARWLDDLFANAPTTAGAEITLEANPESADAEKLKRWRDAGVNRLSLGAQSFDDELLRNIGRIHDGRMAADAFETARAAGFENINLDLMYGLPGQSVEQSRADVARAVALSPEHLSFYQLTLEPNTLFHARPPVLPDDDAVAEMERAGMEQLDAHGLQRYEISAYARSGRVCAHNMNYWRFGDYLGVGAGAHGKLTLGDATCARDVKHRHPETYMRMSREPDARAFVSKRQLVDGETLRFEFILNASRLVDGFDEELFERTTGMPFATITPSLQRLAQRGLIALHDERRGRRAAPTRKGLLFLNDIQGEFLPGGGAPIAAFDALPGVESLLP